MAGQRDTIVGRVGQSQIESLELAVGFAKLVGCLARMHGGIELCVNSQIDDEPKPVRVFFENADIFNKDLQPERMQVS